MIGVEIRKLVRRPRTWVSVALLCLLPTVVAVFLALSGIAPRPGEGPAFLSAVLSNGQLYPAAALGIVLPIFLPVSVAVVAVAVTGYVVGVQLFGTSSLAYATATVSGTPLSTGELLQRTVLMVLYIGWSMLGVAAVSLFLSTFTDSSLGAALGGLAVLVGSTVLVTLDAAGGVRDWLPTRYWLAWVDLFRDPILWHDLQRGVAVQGVYIVVLLGAAWANFATRDVTS